MWKEKGIRICGRRTSCFVLAVFALFSVFARQPAYPESPRTEAEVAIDIRTLKSEVPEFFTYRYRGKNISYFVIKVNDKVFSFLDACASCYKARRGYRFDGGYIICRECDVKYPVSVIEKGVGGCFPIRIAGRLQDEKYFIPVSALEGMADKF